MQNTINDANAATSIAFLGHNGEWWDFWLIIAVIVAALAAAGVGVTTIGSIVSHKREARAADIALAKFQSKTAGEVADANARALEAKLELEKYKAPRTISPEWQDKITAAIKPFAGQQYILSVASGAEAESLLCLLDKTILQAGWKLHAPFTPITVDVACGTVGLNTASDINVRVAPAADADVVAAADALINALSTAGVAAHGATDPKNIPDPKIISVMVGSKT